MKKRDSPEISLRGVHEEGLLLTFLIFGRVWVVLFPTALSSSSISGISLTASLNTSGEELFKASTAFLTSSSLTIITSFLFYFPLRSCPRASGLRCNRSSPLHFIICTFCTIISIKKIKTLNKIRLNVDLFNNFVSFIHNIIVFTQSDVRRNAHYETK